VITAGQRGDTPQFAAVLEGIRVPRPGPGRSRSRPDRVLGDKAYGSRANRAYPTRYDKLAVRYEATVHIAAINEWLLPNLLNRP
jgi:hypothetical protein